MFGNSTNRQLERDQTLAPVYVFVYTYTTSLFNKYFKTVSQKKKKNSGLDQKNQFLFKKNIFQREERLNLVLVPPNAVFMYIWLYDYWF